MPRRKDLYSLMIVLLGVDVAAVPVFDMAQDVFVGGKSPFSTLVENLPLVLLALGIVALGVWLAASDWEGEYVGTVAWTSVATAAGVTALVVLVVFVQRELQGELKPLIIAADAVVIGTLAGVLLGMRTAQQERATDDAAAQRDRFQALFDNVPNPIVGVEFVEEVPVVRAVNPAFTEIFGFDRRTIVGESLAAHIVPEDESFDPADQGRPMTAEEFSSADAWDSNVITLETVDGQREFIRLTAPVDRGPARDRYAIYIDVTAQRQRRERLLVLGRTLRHDIRNQLNVVKLAAQKVADDSESRYDRETTLIENAVEGLLQMSEQAQRVEEQIAGESDPSGRDLVPLVRETAEVVHGEYDCSLSVEAPDSAYGNTTDAFAAAVEAVLTNAIEHNDREHPIVEVSVVESLDGEYYDVNVADDGPGMPQDQLEIITRAVTPTQTRHAEGLGLWTARWVMQNSGGELEFAANAPRGTVVTLRVPQATPVADHAAGADSAR